MKAYTVPKTPPSQPVKVTPNLGRIFRAAWWVAILILVGYLTYTRWAQLTVDKPSVFDTGLLALLAILVLLPFVSEVSALGFTVKKQIDEAKKELKQDVKEEVQTIRSELLALGISNRLTSNVILQGGLNPPPDDALNDVKKQIEEVLRQFQAQSGISKPPHSEGDVSQNIIFAFKQRLLIEKELRRIWETRIGDVPSITSAANTDRSRYPTVSRIVEDLVRCELINPNLGRSLKEIYAVASAAIHGEEPSQDKIDFLRAIAPEVINTLSVIR